MAGAILYALSNLPLDTTLSLPPPHHAANESRTHIDIRDIPSFHVRRRPVDHLLNHHLIMNHTSTSPTFSLSVYSLHLRPHPPLENTTPLPCPNSHTLPVAYTPQFPSVSLHLQLSKRRRVHTFLSLSFNDAYSVCAPCAELQLSVSTITQ